MNPFPLCPLFVPANKLEWIEKAERSEADGLIIDLEDSVPLEEKSKTRGSLVEYLSTQGVSSAASDVYKRQLSILGVIKPKKFFFFTPKEEESFLPSWEVSGFCLLYTSPSPRD